MTNAHGLSAISGQREEIDYVSDEVERLRTWQPVDLASVLNGTYQPITPTVGARNDGAGLFYPGRVHTVASESEGGKTWLALHACITELERGNAVVYLDFEDDEGGIVGRLISMGCDRDLIRGLFAYIRPEESLLAFENRADLAECLADLRPTLVPLDGVTEGMALHGMELKDNMDIARFGKMLPRWIADQGPAVVALDHVVKDRDNRGRYAIGGVHKLNGLNGAAYLLDNRNAFGINRTGQSSIYLAKDRPGQLRKRAMSTSGGLDWFADLVVESHSERRVTAELRSPVERQASGLRPTHVMAKVCTALTGASGGLSKMAIEGSVGGKRDVVRLALELLVGEGYVIAEKRGNALIHTLARPFEEAA